MTEFKCPFCNYGLGCMIAEGYTVEEMFNITFGKTCNCYECGKKIDYKSVKNIQS